MSLYSTDLSVGDILKSFSYGNYEILDIRHPLEVRVRFVDTGYEASFPASQIRSGHVKDRLFKSVCGVACIGDGPYSKSKDKKVYSIWNSMIERCYSEKSMSKNPTYIGCSVCDEWLNFQNYADWYYTKCPDLNLEFHVDKDLKCFGNKTYSPETCLFVSRMVNNFTEDSRKSRGNTMIGVSWYKSRNKYESYCNDPIRGKRKKLGYFTDEISAHMEWRRYKSRLAEEIAMMQDDYEVMEALLKYKDLIDKNMIHRY